MSVLALVIVVIPPLLVIGPQVTHAGVYSNWGDVAANELSVQNAAHLHQAVGPYDRFGWFHPGPMLFYLLAIPYVLMHWNGAALQVGAALINLVAAVGIVGLVARRAGGKAALGTAAILCAFEFVRGVPYIPNAWGPEVIVLPAVLFFVLCADLAAGAVWSLVGAVVVGTFLVQTEIGTGSAVVIGLGLAGCVRIVEWRVHGKLRPSLRNSRRAVLVALGVGAVLWAPPFWQQVTNSPGNLGVVTNYFLHTNGHHSPGVAFSALAGGLLDPLPGLVGDRGIIHPTDAGLVLLLFAVGALAVICWLRRQWFACALAAGILPVAAVCLLSLERVEGPDSVLPGPVDGRLDSLRRDCPGDVPDRTRQICPRVADLGHPGPFSGRPAAGRLRGGLRLEALRLGFPGPGLGRLRQRDQRDGHGRAPPPAPDPAACSSA